MKISMRPSIALKIDKRKYLLSWGFGSFIVIVVSKFQEFGDEDKMVSSKNFLFIHFVRNSLNFRSSKMKLKWYFEPLKITENEKRVFKMRNFQGRKSQGSWGATEHKIVNLKVLRSWGLLLGEKIALRILQDYNWELSAWSCMEVRFSSIFHFQRKKNDSKNSEGDFQEGLIFLTHTDN